MADATIVSDYYIGHTRIRIADDCCRKTQAEIDAILQRIAQTAQTCFNAAAAYETTKGEE